MRGWSVMMGVVVSQIGLINAAFASVPLANGWTKEQVDAAGRAAGFPTSDYPFYSTVNGCGPDDRFKNAIVPEKPLILDGVSFTNACNQHDRDYCTIGMSREEADQRFRTNLHDAVTAYLNESVSMVFEEFVEKLVPVERWERILRTVMTKKWVERIKPNRVGIWIVPSIVAELVEEPTTVWEDVKVIVNEPRRELEKVTRSVARASTLTPEAVAKMYAAAETYATVVSEFLGQDYYPGSQAKQRAYEAWLAELMKQPPVAQ